MSGQSMEAYDKAQEMFLGGRNRDDVEMYLVKTYPDLNAQGLVPSIVRRAQRDLVAI